MRPHPLAIRAVSLLIRMLCRTLRFEIRDEAGILDLQRPRPLILILWHNRIAAMPYLRRRWISHREVVVLTSPSRDGAWLAGVVETFGLGSVRGSSSRRGAAGLLAVRRWLERGDDVTITPDGPRGPRYRLGPGAVLLAQTTGVPLVPVHVEYPRAWRLRSWDGFFIPHPFSPVKVTFAAPLSVAPTPDDAAFEGERLRIEGVMNAGRQID